MKRWEWKAQKRWSSRRSRAHDGGYMLPCRSSARLDNFIPYVGFYLSNYISLIDPCVHSSIVRGTWWTTLVLGIKPGKAKLDWQAYSPWYDDVKVFSRFNTTKGDERSLRVHRRYHAAILKRRLSMISSISSVIFFTSLLTALMSKAVTLSLSFWNRALTKDHQRRQCILFDCIGSGDSSQTQPMESGGQRWRPIVKISSLGSGTANLMLMLLCSRLMVAAVQVLVYLWV